MVGIENDFSVLDPVHTVLGAQLLYLHFENLQDQCIIIGAPKGDAELISKMRGKMVGSAFTNFKFTTRLAEHGANPQPVVRMAGRAPPVRAAAVAPLTWLQFGQHLDTLADETTLQASKTTILRSSTTLDGSIINSMEHRATLAEAEFQAFSGVQDFQQTDRSSRSILKSGDNRNRDRSRSRDSSSGRARFSDSPGNTPRYSRSSKQIGQPYV
jgi:hypothetical protein